MTLLELQLLCAAALIFVPLELLLPLHARKETFRPGVGVDVLHALVSGFLIRSGTVATGLVLSYACRLLVPEGIRAVVRGQVGLVQFAELLLLADLFFYAAHRLVHTVPWLWRFHAVHHSSEQMDWLATFRVHPVDQIVNSTIIAIPALALGFSATPLLAYALLYRAHAMLLHSNVRADFGPLNRVVASPLYHHWHHADEPGAHNRNFGGQLAIWDVLFGTLYEAEALPAQYGTATTVPKGYVLQLLSPFLPSERRQGQSPRERTMIRNET